MKYLQEVSSSVFAICGSALLIAGQYHGYHMTEGEKLVELWKYWVSGGSCIVGAVLILRSPKFFTGDK